MKQFYFLFFAYMIALPLIGQKQKTNSTDRIVHIDFTSEQGPLNTMFKECIGAGRANEGLRADWQQQLSYVKKECGFKYIRMHGLLTDDMAVYSQDKNGKPKYNYM